MQNLSVMLPRTHTINMRRRGPWWGYCRAAGSSGARARASKRINGRADMAHTALRQIDEKTAGGRVDCGGIEAEVVGDMGCAGT